MSTTGKLTREAIEALCPEDGRRRRLSDGHRLYIVAQPSGAKRWECGYTDSNGREHRRALGLWPTVGLEEARRKHAQLLAKLRAGPIASTVGLFAGIGGIERGLEAGCGARPVLLCELRPEAQAVLRRQFPDAEIVSDVQSLETLPEADMLCGGFPCQDISLIGQKAGLAGARSGLINEVFRLLERMSRRPECVLLENVPNLIVIDRGSAMRYMTDNLSSLGYQWAYRIIDPRSFGVPHRRPRIFFLASRSLDPAAVLFPGDENPVATISDHPSDEGDDALAYGFYWTSGKIGIGWARDSLPPLKAGAPPATAVWDVKRDVFGLPALEDAEKLQGFPPGWTDAAPAHARWRLLGNAVNARVSEWIGQRIRTGGDGGPRSERTRRIYPGSWPAAAYGSSSGIWAVEASAYPEGINYTPILQFLQEPLRPLSLPAALGFRRRALSSTAVHYPSRFLASLDRYLRQTYGWAGEQP